MSQNNGKDTATSIFKYKYKAKQTYFINLNQLNKSYKLKSFKPKSNPYKS